MSVIVTGMQMPTSCASCRMAVCFADTGRAKCYATLSYIDPERGKRSYDCPLRPLPEKHGDLIDRDVMLFCVLELGLEGERAIETAPAIVEAEG